MKFKFTVILLTSILFGCAANKTNNEEIVAKITRYGIYETVDEYTMKPDKRVPSGIIGYFKVGFVEQTDIVPLILGIRFGYDFIITGLPKNKEIELILVIEHPPILRHDGVMSSSFEFTKRYYTKSGIIRDGQDYILNHEYELVPGKWVQLYRYKGKVILEKEFTVLPNE